MADSTRQNIVNTIKQYGKGLFSFIRGKVSSEQDAEDILQDVWYALSNVVNIAEIEQMSGWLFRVAKNRIIDKYRKGSTEYLEDLAFDDDETDFDLNDILLADDDDPETAYLKDMFWQELFAALDELPEKQREVFVLNELEDKTLQQIAEESGVNLKTIISRKGYAVKYLRERLAYLYNELMDY